MRFCKTQDGLPVLFSDGLEVHPMANYGNCFRLIPKEQVFQSSNWNRLIACIEIDREVATVFLAKTQSPAASIDNRPNIPVAVPPFRRTVSPVHSI